MEGKQLQIYCAHTEVVPIGDVRPNPKNPNKHPADQIDKLSKILKRQGWRAAIGVSKRSGLVVRGHGRLAAALHLSLTHVPIDLQDYESEEAELADLLADNESARGSELDWDKASAIFAMIPADMREFTGWTPEDIAHADNDDGWNAPDREDLPDDVALVTYKTTEGQAVAIRLAIQKAIGQHKEFTEGKALEQVAKEFIS